MRKDLLDRGFAIFALAALAALAPLASACAGADGEDDDGFGSTGEELRAGVNGSGCKRSGYDCSLHPGGGGQRVAAADGSTQWSVSQAWLASRGLTDVPVLDGNGDPMGLSKKRSFVLNYGQTRRLRDATYVMAVSAGVGSAGWVPLDMFTKASELRRRVGEVNAHGSGLRKMACYEVASSYPKRLDGYKVVKGATDRDSEEPNDYLPQVRSGNGRVYMNLAFSVPGDGLGAPAVDIFPAGTKFQRLDVPTWERPDRPSLDAALYAKPAGSARYTKRVGSMKFIYGYVKTPGGVRNGWMALDGLKVSRGCPDR
jgi:hypothetical protein